MRSSCFLWASLALFLVTVGGSFAQVPKPGSGRDVVNFIPMRERVKITEKFWKWKKENVLPMVMREQGVDMWIIRNDEEPLYQQTQYREHPVYTSLLPANQEGVTLPSVHEGSLSSNPEFLLFYDTGNEIEYVEPDDYSHITRLVRERDPKKIAISVKNLFIRKQNFGNSAQLSIVTGNEMQQALGSKYASRAVDSLHLGILWLSIMGPEQISAYRYVQRVHNDIIAEAFSNRAIIPNVTTIGDLNWWIRDRYLDLHLEIENHPSVNVRRRPSKIAEYDDSSEYFRNGRTNVENIIIRRGDVVGLDSGMMLLGLGTDSQQFVYVLQKDESDVPEDLKEALRLINEMQDAYRKAFVVGRTDQEIREAGNNMMPHDPRIINSRFHFHPPPMFIRRFTRNGGMFSRETYVAGISPGYNQHPLFSLSLTLHHNTLYSLEPSTTVAVPGWGENGLSFGTEQIGIFTENGLEYLDRPMLEWHVVK